jgi:hypothetical protein
MPIAQNSRSLISYVEEATFGTTPATPAMVALPINTFNVNLEKGIIENNEIRPDEMQRFERHGDRTVSGDMVADLRKTDFDPFLESVMRSSFSTNTLKVGTTPKFFSMEHGSLDIDEYQVFNGITVNTLGLSMSAGDSSPVQVTFGLIGRDMAPITSTSIADSLVPATNNQPFDHYAGNGFRIANAGGSLADRCITAFELNIDRGYETRYCIGDDASKSYVSGMANIEGSFTAYFESETLINRFVNEVETALEIQAGFGSDIMTFLLPRVKINSANVGVTGNTGAKFVEVTYKALFDTVEQSSLTITRPAP